MEERFERTEKLLGKEAMQALGKARVAVFGIGGVGGYAVEALVRGGVGAIDLIDCDTVSVSNLNRQIIALESNVGRLKTAVAAERIAEINPECNVTAHHIFFLPENADSVDFSEFDYVIDAIDTVSGKLAIIERCARVGVPVISSMGTGNKVDPTKFEVADIYATSVCPLARVMRRELRKRGIERLKVVYSREEPHVYEGDGETTVPGSVSFVPGVAGLIMAGEVVKDLIARAQNE